MITHAVAFAAILMAPIVASAIERARQRAGLSQRATFGRLASGLLVALMLSGCLTKLHAATTPKSPTTQSQPFRDPCDTCRLMHPDNEWVCWMFFCF